MKKFGMMSLVLIVILAITTAAQAPQGGRGGRGAPAPPTPPALQAYADNLAAAINKQDSATLTKMLAADAVYLDEDGHAIPAGVWAGRITAGNPPKVFTISGSRGQMIDDNTAWVSFNYTFAGMFLNPPVQKTLSGTASFVLKKTGADWTALMVHGALKQSVAGLTQ
jgi:hypothetical protein